mmetsp:Transcript_3808/g.5122  ORF Transcript_3808/g.5122 Transcript_3808/m.5122 type:complete len:889 (+) Transcript_3808:188-2854(+)
MSKFKSSPNRVVLTDLVEPLQYDLEMTPNISGDFKFQASVKITLDIKAPNLKSITLHSRELELLSCSYQGEDGEKIIKANGFEYNEALKTVKISFGPELPVSKGFLSIDYIGKHNDQMAGFYRSGYKNKEGEDKIMVSTQFEALDARRCFPCVDEPGRKSRFKCSLIVDHNLTALSNMPEENVETLDRGKKKVTFQNTPKMSTYLLAFVVGEFDYIETVTDHGVIIRVYVPPGKHHLGSFSLDVAKKSLDIYDDLFGQPYPLPKLDMVGIPEFQAGAMENWGLVTYRMADLLIDPVRASSSQKQRVGEVVAHELAHQWFGNLVTMEWWDDLWLNEGFASWMQKYAIDSIYPEWKIWEQFIVDDQARAMMLDALASSHPIQVPINHAEEVEQIFDAISYAKGASVIRMIFAYLGEDAFMKGLQLYMKTHQYENTDTSDLWKAWEITSKKPVSKVMASWTEQMGYPVISVLNSAWNQQAGVCKLTVEQSWFLSDGSSPAESKSKLWTIPLFASTAEGEVQLGLFDSKRKEITVKVGKSSWLKLNGGQHVPIRINYTEDLLSRLENGILKQELSAEDRQGVVLDTFALCKAGHMDPASLINLIGSYKSETEFTVWEAVATVIMGLDRPLKNNASLSSKFGNFVAELIKIPAQKVGWEAKEDDGHLGRLHRKLMVGLQAAFCHNSDTVVKEAHGRFEKYIADPFHADTAAILPTELKSSVFRIVLKNASDARPYEELLKILDQEEDIAEKKEIYFSLGYVNSRELKRRTLDWCTSGEIKLQDFFYPMSSVSGSSVEGLELAWEYLQEHFDRIRGMLANANPMLFGAVVTSSASGFTSEEKAKEIEEFFEGKPVDKISRKIQQLVESTRANAKLKILLESSDGFKKYLEEFAN